MQTDISQRQVERVLCSCGHEYEALTWTILDVHFHSDIRESPDVISLVVCPNCREVTPSKLPLILLRGHPDLMIVRCYSDVVEAVNSADIASLLGLPAEPPPGLVLDVPRTLAPEILRIPSESSALDCLARRAGEFEGGKASQIGDFIDELNSSMRYRELHDAFFRSFDLGSFEKLRQLIDDYPVVRASRFCEFLRLHRDRLVTPVDIEYRILSIRIELFCQISSGAPVNSVWSTYAQEMESYLHDSVQPELDGLLDRLSSNSPGAGDSPAARRAEYDRALYLSKVLNKIMLEAELLSNLGLELLGGNEFFSADRALDITECLSRARLLARDTYPEVYARASSNLALVLTRAPVGDRALNQESAIRLLYECLEYYTEASHPDEWALCSTNLAIIYVDREMGHRYQNLRHAVSLCEDALRVRSPERNLLDWAYTVANLAYGLRSEPKTPENQSTRLEHLIRAVELYRHVAEKVADGQLDAFRARVMQNLASVLVDLVRLRIELGKQRRAEVLIESEPSIATGASTLVHPTPAAALVHMAELFVLNPRVFGQREAAPWAVALIEQELTIEDHALMEEAEQAAKWALGVELYRNSATVGVTYKLLGEISAIMTKDEVQRMNYLCQSVAALRENGMDAELLETYSEMGMSYARRGIWNESSKYYYLAIQLLNALASRRSTAEAQSRQIANYSKLAEWAAYALVKAGRIEDAILTIENARASALGLTIKRDEADLGYLASVDKPLAERFTAARDAMRNSSSETANTQSASGAGAPNSVIVFNEVVEQIRRIPRLENFLKDTSREDILRASLPAFPIVYLISTAAGTISVLVRGDDPADNSVDSFVVISDSEITSGDLVSCLMRYDSAGMSGILSPDGLGLEAAVEEVGDLLGKAFGVQLSDYLARFNIDNVVLMPAGVLGSYPLGTAALGSEIIPARRMSGQKRFLCDSVNIAISPSAVVIDGCRRRVLRMSESVRYFAGIGDPEQSDENRRLYWAEAEIRGLQKLYRSPDSDIRIGEDATREFFISAASRASHLHLACHGGGDLEDPLNSAIFLSDGPLTVREIRNHSAMNCRIVVVSACESGRSAINDEANEFIGLPGELIASGASAVVASLWAVDDLATCVLMLRFHEELVSIESSGAVVGAASVALRRAQTWVREKSGQQITTYLMDMVGRNVFENIRKRTPVVDHGFTRAVDHGSDRPFAHPSFWAPFVVFGL